MSNEDARSKELDGCVVRNVHITVGVNVSQRFLISKTAEETIDEMFVRLSKESRTPAGKEDCRKCRRIVKWAEECDGEICDIISTYHSQTRSFVMDICVDFKQHTDSEKFCKYVVSKVHESIE